MLLVSPLQTPPAHAFPTPSPPHLLVRAREYRVEETGDLSACEELAAQHRGMVALSSNPGSVEAETSGSLKLFGHPM